MKHHFNRHPTFITFVTFFILFGSCNLRDKYPVDIEDVDTLSVYQRYLDSIAIMTQYQELEKISQADSGKDNKANSVSERWTICTGVFKEKHNARRMFKEMLKKNGSYLIIRNDMHYVTTGIFTNKDSAKAFRNSSNTFAESFVLKIDTEDQLLESFPN